MVNGVNAVERPGASSGYLPVQILFRSTMQRLLCLMCAERLTDGQLPTCDPAIEVGSDRSVRRAHLYLCDVHRYKDVSNAASACPQVGSSPRLVNEFHRDVPEVVDDLCPDEPRAVTTSW